MTSVTTTPSRERARRSTVEVLHVKPRSELRRSGPDFEQITDDIVTVVLPLVREAIMLTNTSGPAVLRPIFRAVVYLRLAGWMGREPDKVKVSLQMPDDAIQEFSAFWMVQESSRFLQSRERLEALSRNPRYLDERNWRRVTKKTRRHVSVVVQEHYQIVKSGAVTPVMDLSMEFREGGLFQTDVKRSVREGDWVGEHPAD